MLGSPLLSPPWVLPSPSPDLAPQCPEDKPRLSGRRPILTPGCPLLPPPALPAPGPAAATAPPGPRLRSCTGPGAFPAQGNPSHTVRPCHSDAFGKFCLCLTCALDKQGPSPPRAWTVLSYVCEMQATWLAKTSAWHRDVGTPFTAAVEGHLGKLARNHWPRAP